MGAHCQALILLLGTLLVLLPRLPLAGAATRYYTFNVKLQNVTRLCNTRAIPTVNGKFPGPKIVTREGDRVVVKVVNNIKDNITIHWHGVRQMRTGWSDGPAYVTQCPIQTGQSFVYNFTITGQRGTLFWHAHVSWMRSTLYGPIVILPKPGVPLPFAKPHRDVAIVFGEWFNADPEAIIAQAMQTGGGPNVSDAYTINGLPGPLYNCSSKDTFRLKVRAGETYLLRLINAALNDELFFSVANHTLTVVDVDAAYVKPFDTNLVLITPGQTTNVLLRAKPDDGCPPATHLMLARPYATGSGTFDNTTVAAVLEYYATAGNIKIQESPALPPGAARVQRHGRRHKLRHQAPEPRQPGVSCERAASRRQALLLHRGTRHHPVPGEPDVPRPHQHHHVHGLHEQRVLQHAHHCAAPGALFRQRCRRVHHRLPHHAAGAVQLHGHAAQQHQRVERDQGGGGAVQRERGGCATGHQHPGRLAAESHPLHLHGFDFFVVGQGSGNYDPAKHPAGFNLVDPVQRNTVGVPAGGWVAIRFFADNPGVWFMHCHLEVHTTWGLKMAWVVNDGPLPEQKLMPPPSDLPTC